MASRSVTGSAEKNRATLKSLVKLEANKSCSDCKRNKHPRWASWNLGVFVCIRCSGIHRSMGVHISRVKSVDLDTWTDEQTQNMLRWGNARANRYWEAKLAPGHVPSESKIDNFIRTKYESKRWTMDGPIPDPATLDVEGDDDVPLNIVQEKAKLATPAAQMAAPPTSAASRRPVAVAAPPRNLFDDEPAISAPARSNTGPPAQQSRAPPPAAAAKPAESLLGLDFFGSAPSAPPQRSASTAPPSAGAAGVSRPDLKQSILSLYASSSVPAQPRAQAPTSSFGMASPGFGNTAQPQGTTATSTGLFDSFGGLSLGNGPAPTQSSDPFASLSQPTQSSAPKAPTKTSLFSSTGSFFDTPTSPPPAPRAPPAKPATSLGQSSSGLGDLGDLLSDPAPFASAAPQKSVNQASNPISSSQGFGASNSAAPNYSSSAFNLSARQPAAPRAAIPAAAPAATTSSADIWGSNSVWGAEDPKPTSTTTTSTFSSQTFGTASSALNPGFASTTVSHSTMNMGQPEITGDDDFGGWSSAAPETPGVAKGPVLGSSNAGASGGGDDLFSNVWQ